MVPNRLDVGRWAQDERVELVRGRNVLLRLTEPGDAADIVSWRNQPGARKWLNQGEALTVEAHMEWYLRCLQRGELLIVFEKPDGHKVACCSVFDFDDSATSAEWGRLTSSEVGGGGTALLEGCYLLHRMCFDAFDFRQILGRVWTDNERAWRLYRFLGWREEGLQPGGHLAADGHHEVRQIRVRPESFAAARQVVERKIYGESEPPVLEEADRRRLREVLSSLRTGR